MNDVTESVSRALSKFLEGRKSSATFDKPFLENLRELCSELEYENSEYVEFIQLGAWLSKFYSFREPHVLTQPVLLYVKLRGDSNIKTVVAHVCLRDDPEAQLTGTVGPLNLEK
jgi:hypothetical protein